MHSAIDSRTHQIARISIEATAVRHLPFTLGECGSIKVTLQDVELQHSLRDGRGWNPPTSSCGIQSLTCLKECDSVILAFMLETTPKVIVRIVVSKSLPLSKIDICCARVFGEINERSSRQQATFTAILFICDLISAWTKI